MQIYDTDNHHCASSTSLGLLDYSLQCQWNENHLYMCKVWNLCLTTNSVILRLYQSFICNKVRSSINDDESKIKNSRIHFFVNVYIFFNGLFHCKIVSFALLKFQRNNHLTGKARRGKIAQRQSGGLAIQESRFESPPMLFF